MKEEVQLREVTEDDLPIFFDQQRDPEANRMAAFPAREREAFMSHWANILSDNACIIKTVLFEGNVAGNIGSFQQSGRWLVGYWIGRNYWGKGIATRALAQLLGQLKQRPLYAHVAKHNIGSIRVLTKCGFSICGDDKVVPEPDAEEIEELIMMLGSENDAAEAGKETE